MTIAACYLSTEGVVLGADSTATFIGPPERHYNHAQKLFEIGEHDTLGLVTWGLGGLGTTSYRTIIAQFSDDLRNTPAANGMEVAKRWSAMIWPQYQTTCADLIQRYRDLSRMTGRSEQENRELEGLRQCAGGFCIGGRVPGDRTPFAIKWVFGPDFSDPPEPEALPMGVPVFWGCPNLFSRLLLGMDDEIFSAIVRSGKWSGTPQEFVDVLQPHFLRCPGILPLRDAIDWVHSVILITIKAMKFSQMSPVCGGPIEIAAITTDRPFRWVRHKGLDEAIDSHRPRNGGLHAYK